MKWIVDESEPFNSYGYCDFENSIGQALETTVDLVIIVALGILCVQAYRARDIKTEFSEARGVALALFCWFLSSLIVFPTLYVLPLEAVDAQYVMQVLHLFVNNMSLLLFIFIPIISHHRQHCRGSQTPVNPKTRISGLDLDRTNINASNGSPRRDLVFDDKPAQHDAVDASKQQQHPNVPAMVLELQTLRARVLELESKCSAPESRGGHEAATLPQPTEREPEGPISGDQGDEEAPLGAGVLQK
jgi:7 transmembrane sweet-taste receptor of 3 GCPR